MTSQDTQPFRWHFTEFDDQNFQIRGRTILSVAVLVASVILIVLIILCSRWVCRSYGLWNHVPASSGLPHAPPSQGLEPAVISGFPIELHSTKGLEESPECVICLGVFADGEKVKVLPACGHCYHSECVDEWLSGQSSCPICRSSLRVDSAV